MSPLHPTLRRASVDTVKERDFQKLVIDLARLYGWRVAHFRPARTEHGWVTPVAADGKGFPDLVLVHPSGGVVFAELKVGRGLPTDDQFTWLESLQAAGATVKLWIWPEDWSDVRRTLSLGKLPA